jgi:hypothetical protein
MNDLVGYENRLPQADGDSVKSVRLTSDGNKQDFIIAVREDESHSCKVRLAEKRRASSNSKNKRSRFSASSATFGGSIDVHIDLPPSHGNNADEKKPDGNGTSTAGGVDLERIVGETKFTIGFAVAALNKGKDECWDKLMALDGLEGVERVDIEQISGIGCR